MDTKNLDGTIPEAKKAIENLKTVQEVETFRNYEKENKDRAGVYTLLDEKLEEIVDNLSQPETQKDSEQDSGEEIQPEIQEDSEQDFEEDSKEETQPEIQEDSKEETQENSEEDAEENSEEDAEQSPGEEIKEDFQGLSSPGLDDEAVKKLVKQIKENRVTLDFITKMAKSHLKLGAHEALFNSLFIGRAWLGKLLAELNEKNPYANEDQIKDASQIPPTADTKEEDLQFGREKYDFGLLGIVDAIIKLRSSVEEQIQFLTEMDASVSRDFSIARTNAYTNLCEAKFYLGQELSNKRN